MKWSWWPCLNTFKLLMTQTPERTLLCKLGNHCRFLTKKGKVSPSIFKKINSNESKFISNINPGKASFIFSFLFNNLLKNYDEQGEPGVTAQSAITGREADTSNDVLQGWFQICKTPAGWSPCDAEREEGQGGWQGGGGGDLSNGPNAGNCVACKLLSFF